MLKFQKPVLWACMIIYNSKRNSKGDVQHGVKSYPQPEREYGISRSTLSTWVKQLTPVRVSEDGTVALKEFKALQKEHQRLKIGNEIYKNDCHLRKGTIKVRCRAYSQCIFFDTLSNSILDTKQSLPYNYVKYFIISPIKKLLLNSCFFLALVNSRSIDTDIGLAWNIIIKNEDNQYGHLCKNNL